MAEDKKEDAKETTKTATAAAAAAPKKDNTLKIVLIVLGVLFGLGVLGAILMTVFFAAVFHKATENVKVGKNGSTVTVKSSDGQTSATYGTGATLPQGWPSDVPVYKPSTIIYATKSDNKGFSLAAKTSSSTQSVVDYYRTQLVNQGWTSTHESSYGDGTILTFEKGDTTTSVTVSKQANEATDKTLVTVSVHSSN